MSAADEWLAAALATGPADRAGAEAGVRAAYAAAELPEPERYVWCDSPHAGALAAAALVANGPRDHRAERARRRPHPAVGSGAGRRDRAARPHRLVGALGRDQPAQLAPRHRPPGHAAAREPRRGVHAGRRRARPGRGAAGPARRGLRPARRCLARRPRPGRARADEQAGGDGDQAGLGGLAQVARSAGWWWPYERVVVLTERPVALHRDNLGRLHHGDGPALSYPDGWSINAWRGMPIPAEIAAELPTVTAARIQAEENAEMRRVMLEFYGFERYLRESGAKRVHSDECGVLWRVKLPDDEPLVMVEVLNSTPEPDGTRRTYFLRVPPQTEQGPGGRGVDLRPHRGRVPAPGPDLTAARRAPGAGCAPARRRRRRRSSGSVFRCT